MLRYFSKASRGALQYPIVCRLQVHHKAMNTNSKQILLWIGWQFYLPLWRFYLMTPVRVYRGKCCSYKPSSWFSQKRRHQFYQEQNILQKPFRQTSHIEDVRHVYFRHVYFNRRPVSSVGRAPVC